MKRIFHSIPFIAIGALLVFGLIGCDGKGFVLGPYPFEVDITEGVLSPEDFADRDNHGLLAGGVRMDYCNLPTEDMFNAHLGTVVGDLGSSVSVNEIRLKDITVTASEGDFRFANVIILRYIPAPQSGEFTLPVTLGTAFSPIGFGSTVELKPSGRVDLLRLIQAQDANPNDTCPQLEIFVLGTMPTDTITWRAEANVDLYVRAGL